MSEVNRAALAPDAIRELLAATGGDHEFLGELIDTFVVDAPVQVASMRAALVGGSTERLARAAHTLKSSAATFGATDLADLCRALESRARDGIVDGATEAVDAIEASLRHALGALSDLRDRGRTA